MKLVYTRPVRNRIAEIRNYLAEHASLKKADRTLKQLLDKADSLLEQPFAESLNRHLPAWARDTVA